MSMDHSQMGQRFPPKRDGSMDHSKMTMVAMAGWLSGSMDHLARWATAKGQEEGPGYGSQQGWAWRHAGTDGGHDHFKR